MFFLGWDLINNGNKLVFITITGIKIIPNIDRCKSRITQLINGQKTIVPREKLRDKGAPQLATPSCWLFYYVDGTRNCSAIDLARDILQLGRNNLNELGKAFYCRFDEGARYWRGQSGYHLRCP